MTKGKNKIWWIVGSITALGVGLLFYFRGKSKSKGTKSQGNIVNDVIQGAKGITNDIILGGLTYKEYEAQYTLPFYRFISSDNKRKDDYKLVESFMPDLQFYRETELNEKAFFDFKLYDSTDQNNKGEVRCAIGQFRKDTQIPKICGYSSNHYEVYFYIKPYEDRVGLEKNDFWNLIQNVNIIPYIYATDCYLEKPETQIKPALILRGIYYLNRQKYDEGKVIFDFTIPNYFDVSKGGSQKVYIGAKDVKVEVELMKKLTEELTKVCKELNYGLKSSFAFNESFEDIF